MIKTVCNFLSLSVTFTHFLSLSVTFCHFLSLSVTFCHFLSLSVTFCHFLSLSVTFCHSLSLSVTFCHFHSCLIFEDKAVAYPLRDHSGGRLLALPFNIKLGCIEVTDSDKHTSLLQRYFMIQLSIV